MSFDGHTKMPLRIYPPLTGDEAEDGAKTTIENWQVKMYIKPNGAVRKNHQILTIKEAKGDVTINIKASDPASCAAYERAKAADPNTNVLPCLWEIHVGYLG